MYAHFPSQDGPRFDMCQVGRGEEKRLETIYHSTQHPRGGAGVVNGRALV